MVESEADSCPEVDPEEWAEGHQPVETCSSGLETGSVLMRKISPFFFFYEILTTVLLNMEAGARNTLLIIFCPVLQWMWKPELCLENGV